MEDDELIIILILVSLAIMILWAPIYLIAISQ